MPKATTKLDTELGVKTNVHTEDGDGTFHITKEQDVQPTLDYTKYLREQPVLRSANDRHVAEIPPVIAAKLQREGILQDSKRLLKWLDQPENKAFKTWEGHLS
tara:strand:- start:504 stop:812 length:309 start_codon:yes stop_codon:yes gene_type:complete